jgi:hypothetical protein
LYGERIDADAISGLPISTCRIEGYGGRVARLRDVVCRPRFLRGVIVRAVWCELETHGGRRRLLLSTDPTLSAPVIVEAYSNRWSTEPMFSDFKSRGFGVEDTQIQHPDRLARLLLIMALAITRPSPPGSGTPRPTRHRPKERCEASAEKGRTVENLILYQRLTLHRPPHTQRLAAASPLSDKN